MDMLMCLSVLYTTRSDDPNREIDRFQLPSVNITTLTASKDLVAILLGNSTMGYEVAICNTAAKCLKTFQIRTEDFGRPHRGPYSTELFDLQALSFVREEQGLLVLLTRGFGHSQDVAHYQNQDLGYGIFSMSGELLSQSFLSVASMDTRAPYGRKGGHIAEVAGVEPCNAQGDLSISLNWRHSYRFNAPADSSFKGDTIAWNHILGFGVFASVELAPPTECYPCDLFAIFHVRETCRWRATTYSLTRTAKLYMFRHEVGDGAAQHCDASRLTIPSDCMCSHTLRCKGVLGHSASSLNGSEEDPIMTSGMRNPGIPRTQSPLIDDDCILQATMLVNGSFLVVFHRSGLLVWCFDEGGVANGQPTDSWECACEEGACAPLLHQGGGGCAKKMRKGVVGRAPTYKTLMM